MRLILYYKRLSIRNKGTLIISLFGLLLISFYTLYSCSSEKKISNGSIDEKLRIAAHSINSIYGKEFHDRITNRHSITQEENIKDTNKLNILAKNPGVEYIYTVVMENDSVFFTSGNTNEEDIKGNGYELFNFHYPDAGKMLIKLFSNNKICFEEYPDSYGKLRSVYIPVKNSEERIFIDLASSGNEQSKPIEIISIGIDSITRVINQNAASVQQVAGLSVDMNSLINKLRSKINRFRVSSESVII